MYEVSAEYKQAIRGHSRKFGWRGSITTKAGRVYPFTVKDIVKGSGTLTRSCSGSTSLEMGSVYSAELDISLFLDIDRYSLYDAVVELFFVYMHKNLEPEEIPMGKFVISEATRTMTVLQIKAYDHMLKFEKDMSNSSNTRSPYEWLRFACDACGVPIGVTEQDVSAMPNGTKRLTYTLTDDTKTYRDLISQVAVVLCGVCQIDRLGRLVVIPFSNTPVMDIPASWRYSSKIADYITKYTGLYATYRAGGLTEYYHVEPDDGLIYNIGTNPLLQIAATSERKQILQAIISRLASTTYTPFEAEIPGDPALDPMDVLSLSGGQARGEIACITEIVYRVNGKGSIKCVGENPRLNQAKSRYTKDIEGLLAQNDGIEGTSTFWMSDAYSNADMMIAGTETVVTATEFEIQTDKSRGEIIWTGTYSLDEPGVVTANVYLDQKLIYSCKDYRFSGNTTLTVSTPFEIRRGDEGVHEVRIALSCQAAEESDLTALERQLASLENRVRQIEKGFENEIAVEDVVHGELAAILGRIDSQASAEHITAGSFDLTELVGVELKAMFAGFTENVEGETGS